MSVKKGQGTAWQNIVRLDEGEEEESEVTQEV